MGTDENRGSNVSVQGLEKSFQTTELALLDAPAKQLRFDQSRGSLSGAHGHSMVGGRFFGHLCKTQC